MKLQFIGAAQMVTGSCYLLEANGHKILVDCGMYQGSKEIKELNYQSFPFNPKDLTCCLLTHAHTDHSGLIPKLFKEGFAGPVIATKATVDLCRIMLPDSGHIQEMEVERKNRKRLRAGQPPLNPIYTSIEASECIKYFSGVEYNEVTQLTPSIKARFVDAGHILGSSMVEVWVREEGVERKLVFSGDIGNVKQPYIEDPSCIAEADYVIMESTYGNRMHEDSDDKLQRFKEIINDTFEKGGNLIIPAFAIERTQDILYYLNLLLENKDIPPVDMYIDSPLAIAATEIFRRSFKYFDSETKELIEQGDNPLNMPRLHFSQTAEDSKQLNFLKGSAIIIAASGMADAGRIKHHLKHNLWRPECTVLFVGYQAEGTLGRRLVNGEKKVTIHGEEVIVKANIQAIDGFSAHADQEGLIKWAQCFSKPPKGIILVHGEHSAQEELAVKIQEATGIEPLVPSLGETFEWTATEIVSIPGEIKLPVKPEIEVQEEEKPVQRRKREKVSQAQINKALLRLRSKLKEMVDRGRREQELSTLLHDLQEMTDWVDGKLNRRAK